MQKQAWAFLLIGFGIGFGVLYTWTKQRAPEVVRAMPLPVGTAGPQTAQSEPPPPPLDMARVQALQDQLKTNPKNFDALTELGNMFIVNPLRGRGFVNLFSTHPPLEERIARLEAMVYGQPIR